MFISKSKHLFVFLLLGVVSLLALACSSQVPVSTTVGGAQVGEETAAAVQQAGVEAGVEVRESPSPQTVETTEEVATDPAPAISAAEGVLATESGGEAVATVTSSADVTDVAGGGDIPAQVSGREGQGSAGIVVSGSGRASAAPDLATLRLGVEAIEATVGEARTAAAEAMSAVMASVSDDGVEAKDVQTGYFSIQPRYTGREITRCIEAEASGEKKAEGGAMQEGPGLMSMATGPKGQECFQEYRSVITGYEVSNNLTVLVRDLETVDDIIDGAVDAGGDNIRFNGLSFSLEDTTELESEARSAAVSDLEAKADELAGLAGVELGELVYLTESGGYQPPIVRAEFALARAAADSAGGEATPISPGEISVRVNVVGQYMIGGGE
ncbi:MAG: SIMPL domain-containing protein [Chloroflexota bacterium]|nr:SIMPL domain-containing protein [Chloroflexota bacterium]